MSAQLPETTSKTVELRLDIEPVVAAQVSRALFDLTRRVAATDCTVLISGESGTGKEVLARYIHRHSTRAAAPFIAVNCAAIPETMLEALLFGYERGAFTGATSPHPGKFEQAQGGTLLLDEITEMPLGLQAKLLRVLQEREVERLGSRTTTALDVRVLATTNRNLRAEVAAGRFREDLFYRLCVFPLAIAPLRERRDDVLPLAMQLLATRSPPGARIPALSAEAAQFLLTYAWPGNVRELDNLLQRALILLGGSDVLRPEHVLFEPAHTPRITTDESASRQQITDAVDDDDAPLADSLRIAERDTILAALRGGRVSRRDAADHLGISQRTLRYKLARLRAAGVDVPAA